MEINPLQVVIPTFKCKTLWNKLSILDTVFNGDGFMIGHISIDP